MNTKIFNAIVLCICGVLFCLIAADVNGKWRGVIDYNGRDVSVSYQFKTEGSKVTGTAETPVGVVPIEQGKLEKDMLTFKADLNGETVTHVGRVSADSINLKINYQGLDYNMVLKRDKGL
ncbi:hypothetical protein [Mucilaginibacter sp. CSA2-8R]|uniref:hypothetical protein n=1 Tax=Mucilaginibacter sp. CSA2-8R TaxID=3141542 RepID=UPI00315CA2B7